MKETAGRMRIVTLILAALMFAAGCETYVPAAVDPALVDRDAEDVIDDTIVVTVKSRESELQLTRQARRRGYELLDREQLQSLELFVLRFRAPPGVSRSAAIRELERMEPGATAGANHRYRIQGTLRLHPQSPDFASSMLGWSSPCPTLMAIGMIDSSVGAEGELSGVKLVERDFAAASDAGAGASGHGRVVAALLAGDSAGATIFSAAVIGKDGDAGVPELIRAIDWLVSSNVRVINVSLAGPFNKILDRVIQKAAAQGAIFVAAVGNDGAHSPPRYPAAFRKVIAVTAIDKNQRILESAVRGEHVDLAAPGVDVYVARAGGRFSTGTSIAAPFVTRRIASDPELSRIGDPLTVKRMLATEAIDLGPQGRDDIFGHGLLRPPSGCRIARQ